MIKHTVKQHAGLAPGAIALLRADVPVSDGGFRLVRESFRPLNEPEASNSPRQFLSGRGDPSRYRANEMPLNYPFAVDFLEEVGFPGSAIPGIEIASLNFDIGF